MLSAKFKRKRPVLFSYNTQKGIYVVERSPIYVPYNEYSAIMRKCDFSEKTKHLPVWTTWARGPTGELGRAFILDPRLHDPHAHKAEFTRAEATEIVCGQRMCTCSSHKPQRLLFFSTIQAKRL
ncbi:hypothetical protein Sjap_010166 [Stephania japonica]|uniref:Uncharacterized protein n=1 Tax=Stephania japonica TaxID=461633 RepID=A0AAP0J932_9MAGN